MVAVIHLSRSLRHCLIYNEQKVKAGHARILEAGYYPMDAADMTFYQKLARLEKLTQLNQQAKVNCVHISLNFHPSEKLSDDLLKEVSEVFLEKIGFAGQPYLLYQHVDSGHPHVHLVTTNIKTDGRAISTHHISMRTRPVCLEMEKQYGLVVTGGKENNLRKRFITVNVQRALYGKMETKRTMDDIIHAVTSNYNFTSLEQLNAVLGLYNVVADPGAYGSWLRKHGGLLFRMLDEAGNKIGMPVKASDFDSKPTLKRLRELFEKNGQSRDRLKQNLKTTIDLALLNGKMNLGKLIAGLKGEGIDVVVRRGNSGVVYGMFFVDHKKKVIFNGHELGKAYSAERILERCPIVLDGEEKKQDDEKNKLVPKPVAELDREFVTAHQNVSGGLGTSAGTRLVDVLPDAGEQLEVVDWSRKRKTKKKKQQRLPQV